MLRTFFLLKFLTVICLMTSSCGSSKQHDQPDLGEVTGVVVLDGNPVEGVSVQFIPEKGRSSNGLTNEKGRFELSYLPQTKGAKVGKHKVIIQTPVSEDEFDPEAPKPVEKIPAKYNTKSTLTAEVKAGENQLDFELTSK